MADIEQGRPVKTSAVHAPAQFIAVVLGLYVLAGGLVSFLAWPANLPRLADWIDNGIVTQPNSALAAICAAAAVLLLVAGKRHAVALLGSIVGMIGLAGMLQHVAGVDLQRLNTFFSFNRPWGHFGTLAPGLIGLPSAACWMLIGLALMLAANPAKERARVVTPLLAIITLSVALVYISGYVFQAPELLELPHLTFALQTISFMAMISVALLAALSGYAPVRWLLDPGTTGLVARRATPFILVVPIAFGWLHFVGEPSGLYDSRISWAIFVLAIMTLLLAVLGWCLATLYRQERSLGQTERRLADTLENITDGFVAIDRSWRYTFVNQTAARLTQKAPRELLGRIVWDVFPEMRGTALYETLHRVVNEHVSVEFEDFNAAMRRWFSNRAFPTDDGGVALYFADITGRKRAEQALRDKDAELEKITDNTDTLLMRCSRDLRYVFVNRACAEMFGLRRNEIEGRPIAEVVGQQAFEVIRPHFERALAGEVVEYEAEIPYAGTRLCYMHVKYVPDRDSSGNVVGWLATVSDHTERRAAELALQKSTALARDQAQQLEHIYETSPVGMCLIDRDMRYVRVNQRLAEMNGVPAADHIGRTVRDVVPAWADVLERALAHVLETDQPVVDLEILGATASRPGVPRTWLASGYAQRDGDGATVGVNVVAQEISERKHAENELLRLNQELQQVDRQKDEFVATLAHELRNPLAPIQSAVQLLQSNGGRERRSTWSVDVIARQAQQMARLLDDLLDISRISRNHIALRRQVVSLQSVIDFAVETSRPLIDARRHELALVLPAEVIHVDADPARLAQIFSNLLNNAAKYTPQRGHIRLSAERRGSDVTVAVADDGTGIEAGRMPQLFETFAVGAPQVKQSGGLGIGLSLAKQLVELHGGTITVHSAGRDAGSQFIVQLPIVADLEPAGGPSPLHVEPDRIEARPRRLLIVDDLKDGALTLAALLKMDGHEVMTAFNGEEAIETAEAFRPDIVLLDIGMPKLNGYDTCRYLRARSWAQATVFVALTGWGQESDRRRAHEAGFDHHFVKPIELGALMNVIASLR